MKVGERGCWEGHLVIELCFLEFGNLHKVVTCFALSFNALLLFSASFSCCNI